MQKPLHGTRSPASEILQRDGRPRATSLPVVHGRAARQVTQPIASKLSLWHARIARLRGMAQYGTNISAQFRAEIDTLSEQMRTEHLKFFAVVATLPPEVASHSRIIDTRRALDQASSSLREISRPKGEQRV